jgi:single-strand DNA-binding protein
MANHMHQLIIEGFLGRDVDYRFTDGGTEVANFSFGSTRQYKKGEEIVKETTWMKAVAWGALAKIVNDLCEKGSHVIVTGRLRPSKDGSGSPEVFEKKDGSFGANFEMTVTEIRILKGKNGTGEATVTGEVSGTAEDDSFPF